MVEEQQQSKTLLSRIAIIPHLQLSIDKSNHGDSMFYNCNRKIAPIGIHMSDVVIEIVNDLFDDRTSD